MCCSPYSTSWCCPIHCFLKKIEKAITNHNYHKKSKKNNVGNLQAKLFLKMQSTDDPVVYLICQNSSLVKSGSHTLARDATDALIIYFFSRYLQSFALTSQQKASH